MEKPTSSELYNVSEGNDHLEARGVLCASVCLCVWKRGGEWLLNKYCTVSVQIYGTHLL